MSLIRDRTRGTSQLYLRPAWTSAFKQFFLFLSPQQVRQRHVNISIHISNVLDRGTCTKVFIDDNCWNYFTMPMFLWKLPKRMFYPYYMTFEGLLIPDSGIPDLSLPKTSARVCDKKGAKNVVIRHLLCFVWTFWCKPHAESEQSNIFYKFVHISCRKKRHLIYALLKMFFYIVWSGLLCNEWQSKASWRHVVCF